MTKAVRIENADSGFGYTPVVEVWEKGYPAGEPDRLVETVELLNPCDVTSGLYITSRRWLVVREKDSG